MYHIGEITVSANPTKLRRQMFFISCGIKIIGNKTKAVKATQKKPSNIGPPFKS
jgi:hypothetical protein